MAQKVQTIIISDLSGDEVTDGNGESIAFSYRGVDYNIDLTSKEASGFDKAIAMYVEHAQRTGGRRQSGTKTAKRDTEQLNAIRQWWRDQGNEIGDRGRIPAHVEEAYNNAHK